MNNRFAVLTVLCLTPFAASAFAQNASVALETLDISKVTVGWRARLVGRIRVFAPAWSPSSEQETLAFRSAAPKPLRTNANKNRHEPRRA